MKRKLSDDEVANLRAEFADPAINRQDLARKYGISRSTLYRLCDGAKIDDDSE